MGSSSQNTQSTQQSSTSPWQTGQGIVNGITSQLNPLINNSGINPTQTGAINSIEANASQPNPYAGGIQGLTTNLLNGGGATNQAGAVNQNYQDYVKNTQPLASNTNYNPYDTPGFSNAINTMTSDITNGVNGSFAAAGRDFSGANQGALSRGLTQGLSPTIAAQYNANVANQQGAASNLYNAGNTNAGILSGLQQQGLTNAEAGASLAPTAFNAPNMGANATLAAEGLRQGIPAQNLGMLANIGIPIAGLGTQSTGSGTSNTTYNPSLLSQIGSVGGMFSAPAGGTSMIGGLGQAAAGLGSAGASGISGLLSFLSDRKAKDDIEVVGALFDGTPVYRYRYKGHNAFQIGLMADEVEKHTPAAVSEVGGFKVVEYKAATEKAARALAWGC